MMKYNFLNLVFPDPVLDVADVLTTVGVTISVGGTIIKWASDCGDLGATPAALDCTPLASRVQLQKSGIQELGQWELTYYENNEDYSTLETAKTAGTSQAIVVTMPNGATYTNNGKVTANYPTGRQVNNVAQCRAVFELSNPNGWVRATPTP